MLDLHEDSARNLYLAAQKYLELGWSVIPVYGESDLRQPKAPPIKWKKYQQTLPQDADLGEWFLKRRYRGLAVVCGQISHLCVLDFDDPDLAAVFAARFPELTHTWTVLSGSRKLPHYYWHVPDHMDIPARSIVGVDLRGEKSYVVAAPTTVENWVWQVVSDSPPQTITRNDLDAVWRFLAHAAHRSSGNTLQAVSASNPPTQVIPPASVSIESIHTPDDLIRCYQAQASAGRNNALFMVACMARDQGWTEADVRFSLAWRHAGQTSTKQGMETLDERYNEALRTIHSVFSRPPRPIKQPAVKVSTTAVPNSVREALLQHGLTAAARVLEGLHLAGFSANQPFTEKEASLALHQYGIGRRSVLLALTAHSLFQPLPADAKIPQTPLEAANAANNTDKDPPLCSMGSLTKRVKNRGRKPVYYRMPDVDELARQFGAGKKGAADPIQPADLKNASTYRRALHRELIKRRPGQYGRRWLAARLGISDWTCRRYDRELGLDVQPRFCERKITWSNLESLLPEQLDDLPQGVFLEDETSKHYPPLRHIARHLLNAGKRVVHKLQEPNFYACQHILNRNAPLALLPVERAPKQRAMPVHHPVHQPPISVAAHHHPPIQHPEQNEFWVCKHCLNWQLQPERPHNCSRCGHDGDWEQVAQAIWRDADASKRWWKALWREHHRHTGVRLKPRPVSDRYIMPLDHPDDEAAAATIHCQIKNLSIANARRLIVKYGTNKVIEVMKLLTTRPHITNPAGFLITVLRSEHKFYSSHALQPPKRKPAAPESSGEWVQKMAASPYVHFLANADEFIQSQLEKG